MAAGAERRRIGRIEQGWRRWGPYLSERAWGTVREDYSADGRAWDSFPHDHARSRAYRWNEDGLAGISDERQRLCLALALWNGADPILKERAFGLTGDEGNHGEDVKEYWWYEDAVPTHSYLRWRYAYPQRAFPYDDLVATNRARSRTEPEYELLDTGVFDGDRFFDVEVVYAKAGPDDVCVRIRAVNRGPEAATLHLLPTLWFRDVWSWTPGAVPPVLRAVPGGLVAEDPELGTAVLSVVGGAVPLVCDNATNTQRLYGVPGPAHPKDGIGDHVLTGAATVDPAGTGTKGALHVVADVPAGGVHEVRLRLVVTPPGAQPPARRVSAAAIDRVIAAREAESDEYWADVTAGTTADEALVVRRALAGMIWSKQYYEYDVDRWLTGDPGQPVPPPQRLTGRNSRWRSFRAAEVVSMPDPWEYPWFAAWDLAFHCTTLALVDPGFAKQQLAMVMGDGWMHPTGQIPAYEWDFGAVNPPVHAWAALQVFRADGSRDTAWLRRVFERLVLNFAWWVGRNDPEGDGVFSGGFLGMDNIGPFDRGAVLPDGAVLEQADATGWMGANALAMLEIAVLLGRTDPSLEDLALYFFGIFTLIARASADSGLWDEEDGFFYDRLVGADGRRWPVAVRSFEGLVPLFAVTTIDADRLAAMPRLRERIDDFLALHPRAAEAADVVPEASGTTLMALVDRDRLARVLDRVGDPAELLSPHGVRSVSAAYRDAPYVFRADGGPESGTRIDYEPAESTTPLFGGNSNWRGPVWMPVNVLLVDALHRYGDAVGGSVRLAVPTGSGSRSIADVADDLAARLVSLYLPGPDGRRAVWGGEQRFRDGWRDRLLFFEYFEGDDGAGLGASHQTGWTGLVANLLLQRAAAGRRPPAA